MAEVFQHLSAELVKMDIVLRSAQVLKQEAEETGLQGKDIAEYVTRHRHWIEKGGQLGEMHKVTSRHSSCNDTSKYSGGKDTGRGRGEKERR